MRKLPWQVSLALMLLFIIALSSQVQTSRAVQAFQPAAAWPAAPAWSGTGHFPTELLYYTPSSYSTVPYWRQASTSTGTAANAIAAGDQADLFINFSFDTSGKTIYVVYTTNGTAPNKSNGSSLTATFSNYSAPNSTWRVQIPAQAAGVTVNYVFYPSDGSLANGWGRISGTAANRDTSQYQNVWDENDGSYFTYTVVTGTSTPTPSPTITPTPGPTSLAVNGAKALWLDTTTIAWAGASGGASYKLLYDPDGGVTTAAEATACTFPTPAGPCYVSFSANGSIANGAFPKNPNANGLARLTSTLTSNDAAALLKGQTVVAAYNGSGSLIEATRTQVQSVLDVIYAGSARVQTLGVTYTGDVPSVKLWAPTAKSVSLLRYADSSTTTFATHNMALDSTSGVWSVTGINTWNRQYYLFDVEVYVPSADQVVHNIVSDPYSLSLSQDAAATNDVRSQFVNLADADLKPAGWDTLSKPALAAPEDIVVYEVHVRDFSINDTTVTTAAHRGTYKAFTYDGNAGRPLSNGMRHLKQLQTAGLTHIHLLPAFDIASVIEKTTERAEPSISFNPATDRASATPQAAVGSARATDGFNWGYDPFHYGVPEGSYSTNPDGVTRIVEFREMVQRLNENGLRVVMDVVYNHTAASGQNDHSVFDKVVPGYYYRYDTNGNLYNSSCCSDTASEYEMFEKLMIDTLKRFAVDYKVDSFRFDLMNLHTRQNMVNVKNELLGLTVGANGVDGTKIYIYGEGWDFGSAVAKGLTACPNCYARQINMTGAGIGMFNDKIRDAAHGGLYDAGDGSVQGLREVRKQGFINGQSYDWNGYCYGTRNKSNLDTATDVLRSSLRASGVNWNGQGGAFTDDPSESVPYIEKHDNETLFDLNVFRLPNGVGDAGACGSSFTPATTSVADRVRSQNMGLSLVGLAQGVPFIQMGADILRSKSLDRNSYDSGDWFNRVDWSYTDNNYGRGLPPAWDNSKRHAIMTPLLSNTSFDPTPANIQDGAEHLREILRIRTSSPLFRLRTEDEVNSRVSFYNTDNAKDAFIIMQLSDEGVTDLDTNYENILVFFNANKIPQTYTIAGANGFVLHPVQSDGIDADPVVQGATFSDSTDLFTIPARTTAVFVSTQALTPPAPPSTLDWVGRLYPRGGVANQVDQGAFTPAGFDVFVRVYETGMTEAVGGNADIACFLHWGKYGAAWTAVAMTWNAQYGNDDEYKATISQSTMNGLTPGTYGFTAYCKKTGETSVFWKADTYDIGGNTADDDQGDGLITVIPTGDPAATPPGGVMVHLFEWRWADIEKECTYLAQKGYTAVQVSPPNEHLVPTADQGGQAASDYPWWVRYQPVTHDTTKFTSRSGTLAEFQSMVSTCNSKGVAIYVDAVFNHMADIEVGAPPAGTAGTQYDANPANARYYGTQYQADDFHTDCSIASYSDRKQVQRCKLSGLPDLDTGKADVQAEIRNYLQALLNMGVKGFRIDGAKHMAAQDLGAILNGLTGPFYVFGEVIDQSSNEPVRDWEYTPYGDVTEFAYPFFLGDKFDDTCGGSLSQLQNLEAGMLPSRFALVFTDNHDNQRGHGVGAGCVVDHRDGQEHVLANIFALAYPYGYPSIMSSYYWQSSSTDNSNDSMGPPTVNGGPGSSGATLPVYVDADNTPDNCATSYTWGKWACEHRRTGVANMVRFRQVTEGEPVADWRNISADHISFNRGAKGFVAINRSANAATTSYATNLPTGVYCNIAKYDFNANTGKCVDPTSGNEVTNNIVVSAGPPPGGPSFAPSATNQIANQPLDTMDAIAIHVLAKVGQPLAVELASLTAEATHGGVVVRWETVSEQDNAGFNVYRAESQLGPWERVNVALIPAAAPGASEGREYSWTDTSAAAGNTYWYLLEDVAADGATGRHGPVSVAVSEQVPNAVSIAGAQAVSDYRPALLLAVVAAAGLGLLGVRFYRRKTG